MTPSVAFGFVPCGTTDLTHAPPLVEAAPAPPGADKVERDAGYALPNQLSSANFVVKWGSASTIPTGQVQSLLSDLEEGWDAQVASWGMVPPAGTDAYLFNVYLGDTGDGAPSSSGNAGWYWRDADGYPMIVLNPTILSDGFQRFSTSNHELFHAMQDAAGSWDYTGGYRWYWEATANWAVGQVDPGNPQYSGYLAAYALAPHLAVTDFDDWRAYGAFIWPQYLSEHVGGREMVVASWASDAVRPLGALAEQAEARGLDLGELFADHAAANVHWDYAAGQTYSFWAGGYVDYLESEDGGLSGELSAEAQVPPEPPEGFGYNVWRLPTDSTTSTIAVDGAATTGWAARLVFEDGAVVAVPFVGATGRLVVEPGQAGHVVVVAADYTALGPHSYEIAVLDGVHELPEEEGPEEPDDTASDTSGEGSGVIDGPGALEDEAAPGGDRSSGSCQAAGAPAWLWLLALLAVRTRGGERRGRGSSTTP